MAVIAGMSSSQLERIKGMGSEYSSGCREWLVQAGYNRRLCSISLAGWPCRVSQALRRYWDVNFFHPTTQG
jgi:hypothetical protein